MKTSYCLILSLFFFFLSIHTAVAQYAGGGGDGYTSGHFLGLLSGIPLDALYQGGPGDGFAENRINSDLQGLNLSGPFAGGAGDGYGTAGFLGLLDGNSTAILFQAGRGDGFDQGRGAGVIRNVVIFPVELISFSATRQREEVVLSWETASELNNDFFTVERSINGTTFDAVAKVAGAGTTQQQQRYEIIDEAPLPGLSYYRLKSTDFDGTFYYSEIVTIIFESAQRWSMKVFSNPNGDNKLQFTLSIPQEENLINIELIDMLGTTLLIKEISNNSGTLLHEISMEGKLASGSYLLRASSNRGEVSKLVVIH